MTLAFVKIIPCPYTSNYSFRKAYPMPLLVCLLWERFTKNKAKKTWLRLLGLENVFVTYTHYARRYMSNGMIHAKRLFREFARVLTKFWLAENWFLNTRSSDSRYIAQWNDFRPIARRHHISWIPIGRKSFHCAMYLLLFPKINFQPIRSCLTYAQFRGMTVGHVSFRWTCIALYGVLQ